jgi:hypothetical protein
MAWRWALVAPLHSTHEKATSIRLELIRVIKASFIALSPDFVLAASAFQGKITTELKKKKQMARP